MTAAWWIMMSLVYEENTEGCQGKMSSILDYLYSRSSGDTGGDVLQAFGCSWSGARGIALALTDKLIIVRSLEWMSSFRKRI